MAKYLAGQADRLLHRLCCSAPEISTLNPGCLSHGSGPIRSEARLALANTHGCYILRVKAYLLALDDLSLEINIFKWVVYRHPISPQNERLRQEERKKERKYDQVRWAEGGRYRFIYLCPCTPYTAVSLRIYMFICWTGRISPPSETGVSG